MYIYEIFLALHTRYGCIFKGFFFIARQNEQYANNPHFVDVLLRKNPNEPSSQCEVLVIKEVQSFLYPRKDLVGRCQEAAPEFANEKRGRT